MRKVVEVIAVSALLLLVTQLARCELFTSIAHMKTALSAERDIADALQSFVAEEEERLKQLKRITTELDAHSTKAMENPDVHFANPVNAFLFIKKFALDWDRDFDNIMNSNSGESMRRYLEHSRENLPKYEDLQGAAAALMRLQDTYKLDTAKIAQGDLRGVKSSVLTVEDCFQLGVLSHNAQDYVHTSLWMNETLQKINREGSSPTVGRKLVLDYFNHAEFMNGNVENALRLVEELLILDPNHVNGNKNQILYVETLQKEKTPDKAQLVKDPETTVYEALCRGEEVMEVTNKERLACRFKTNNHPLLILSPAKEEDVHIDPWIVLYHDVISDSEIESLKRLTAPKLNRATVLDGKTGALVGSTIRISKSAWLKDEDHHTVATLSQRMEAITNLDMSTAEDLQIANYGLGGHYIPHYDFIGKNDKNVLFEERGIGNRLATFLFYLSDVEAGGATVFTQIGVRLTPIKGSAAFWYNLHKNGDGNINTRHAACPVLVGTKWVSNKWIHEAGQEFRRPCSLNANE